MNKTLIFDTSVLIAEPTAFRNFIDSTIVIPITVLDELDKLKKEFNDRGKNARIAIKLLDQLSDTGDITRGVVLDNNSYLKIDAEEYIGLGDNKTYGDNKILACAKSNNEKYSDVCLVTNDINLRVRAKSLGIAAEAYVEQGVSFLDLYAGTKASKDENLGVDLLNNRFLHPEDLDTKLEMNEFVSFYNGFGDEICSGRKTSHNKISLVGKKFPWDVKPRNLEQNLALDLLLDQRVQLITMIGKAGCGKTLISLAAGLEGVLAQKQYKKLICYKAIESVGKDIGFLPGSVEEKLAPHMSSYLDNFEILLTGANPQGNWKKEFQAFREKGRIEMEAITYVRGRSINDAFIILDEAQNLDVQSIKTLLTRAGNNTKIVLLGDIEQIDNKDLDVLNNGLSYVIDKFRNQEIAGHITLVKGERSKLATIASQIL